MAKGTPSTEPFMPTNASSVPSEMDAIANIFTPTCRSDHLTNTGNEELIRLNKALCDKLIEERESHQVTKLALQAEKQRRVLFETEAAAAARTNQSLAASVEMPRSIVKQNLSKFQEFSSIQTEGADEQDGNRNMTPERGVDIQDSILYDVLSTPRRQCRTQGYVDLLELQVDSEATVSERGEDHADPFDLDLLQTPNPEEDDTPRSKMSRALRRHFLDQPDPFPENAVEKTATQVSKHERLIDITPPRDQHHRDLGTVVETKPEKKIEHVDWVETQAKRTQEAASGQQNKMKKPNDSKSVEFHEEKSHVRMDETPANTPILELPAAFLIKAATYRSNSSLPNTGKGLINITNQFPALNAPQQLTSFNLTAPSFTQGKGEDDLSTSSNLTTVRDEPGTFDNVVKQDDSSAASTGGLEDAMGRLLVENTFPKSTSASTNAGSDPGVRLTTRATIETPYAVAMNWKINPANPLFDDDDQYQRARGSRTEIFWLHPVRYQPDREEPNLYRTIMIDFIPLGSELKQVLAELNRVRPGELESIQFLPRIGSATDFMTARLIFHTEYNAQTLLLESEHNGIFINGQKVRVWMVLSPTYPKNHELDENVFINNYTRIFVIDNVSERLVSMLPDKLQSNKQVNMAFVVGMMEDTDGSIQVEFTSIAEAVRAFKVLRADREYAHVLIDFVDDYCAPEPTTPA